MQAHLSLPKTGKGCACSWKGKHSALVRFALPKTGGVFTRRDWFRGALPPRRVMSPIYPYIARLMRAELADAKAALAHARTTLAFEALRPAGYKGEGAQMELTALARIAEAEEAIRSLNEGIDALARVKAPEGVPDALFNAACNELGRMAHFVADYPSHKEGAARYVEGLEAACLWLQENHNVPAQ